LKIDEGAHHHTPRRNIGPDIIDHGLRWLVCMLQSLNMKQHRRTGSDARLVSNMLALVCLCVLFLRILAPLGGAIVALDSPTGVACSTDASRSDAPNQRHHDHGYCCILACAASNYIYIAIACAVAFFLSKATSVVAWEFADAVTKAAPFSLYFAARGPPLRH
jgi:hypothetical protein